MTQSALCTCTGLLGVTWCVAWMLVVSDSPETLSKIHPDERDYIVANRGNSYAKGEKVCVCVCVWYVCLFMCTFLST